MSRFSPKQTLTRSRFRFDLNQKQPPNGLICRVLPDAHIHRAQRPFAEQCCSIRRQVSPFFARLPKGARRLSTIHLIS